MMIAGVCCTVRVLTDQDRIGTIPPRSAVFNALSVTTPSFTLIQEYADAYSRPRADRTVVKQSTNIYT